MANKLYYAFVVNHVQDKDIKLVLFVKQERGQVMSTQYAFPLHRIKHIQFNYTKREVTIISHSGNAYYFRVLNYEYFQRQSKLITRPK